VSEDQESTAEIDTRATLNRRTFVGASVAIEGAVASVSLLPGCTDDDARSPFFRCW